MRVVGLISFRYTGIPITLSVIFTDLRQGNGLCSMPLAGSQIRADIAIVL